MSDISVLRTSIFTRKYLIGIAFFSSAIAVGATWGMLSSSVSKPKDSSRLISSQPPIVYPTSDHTKGLPDEDQQPNYEFGMSTLGAETEVPCSVVNRLLFCETHVGQQTQTQASKDTRQTVTAFIVTPEGDLELPATQMPLRSPFILTKSIWQRKCLHANGSVKRVRRCK